MQSAICVGHPLGDEVWPQQLVISNFGFGGLMKALLLESYPIKILNLLDLVQKTGQAKHISLCKQV